MLYDETNFVAYFNKLKFKCRKSVKNKKLLTVRSADPITEFLKEVIKTINDEGKDVPDIYTGSKQLLFDDPMENAPLLLEAIEQKKESTEAARAQLKADWETWAEDEGVIYEIVFETLENEPSLMGLVPDGAGRALLKAIQDKQKAKKTEKANEVCIYVFFVVVIVITYISFY